MADPLSKGKALFLGILQVEIAFFFSFLITFHARVSISSETACHLDGGRAERLWVWLVDPSLIVLTSFIIISVPLLFSHLLLTQNLGE